MGELPNFGQFPKSSIIDGNLSVKVTHYSAWDVAGFSKAHQSRCLRAWESFAASLQRHGTISYLVSWVAVASQIWILESTVQFSFTLVCIWRKPSWLLNSARQSTWVIGYVSWASRGWGSSSLSPDLCRIMPGHEYTKSNAAFAMGLEPFNAALQQRNQEVNDLRAKVHSGLANVKLILINWHSLASVMAQVEVCPKY